MLCRSVPLFALALAAWLGDFSVDTGLAPGGEVRRVDQPGRGLPGPSDAVRPIVRAVAELLPKRHVSRHPLDDAVSRQWLDESRSACRGMADERFATIVPRYAMPQPTRAGIHNVLDCSRRGTWSMTPRSSG
jgi:hypothetical protein